MPTSASSSSRSFARSSRSTRSCSLLFCAGLMCALSYFLDAAFEDRAIGISRELHCIFAGRERTVGLFGDIRCKHPPCAVSIGSVVAPFAHGIDKLTGSADEFRVYGFHDSLLSLGGCRTLGSVPSLSE